MLFTFKSTGNADLIMYETSGKEILALLGKHPEDARGVITVEQLPAAISTLKKAVAATRAVPTELNAKEGEADAELPVNLHQRAVPFIEMLERAAKAGEPVVWGV